jgi:anaerobic nitric oxide reductase flavorubredoxin
MATVEIKPNIHWIGVNDRTTDLFEGLWPITQEGVSYNSYLINDQKKAVIDLSKSIKTDLFFDNLAEIVDLAKIDYLVINHMEPDHTGVFKNLRRMAPELTILGTPKTRKMLSDYYGITENFREVQDGEKLSLGKTELQFHHAPFVHWPETMVTYETTQKILFSCDAFGGYGALRGAIFDDQCTQLDFYIQESLRYFVNIVAKFTGPVLRAIGKLSGIPVEIIAPSHGLIWRKNPGTIVELYKKWSQYATEETEPGVTMVYGSMYGNTETMMNAVAHGISSEEIPLQIFDSARTHVSYILPSLWVYSGVAIGAPTYETGLFPPVAQVLDMAVSKRINNKKAAMFGSFGWSGGALRRIKQIVEPAKWSLLDTFEFCGGPTKADLQKGEEFGARFARAIKKGSA